MKNKLLLSSLALILSSPLMAANPVQGWYFGIMGTGSDRSSIDITAFNPVTSVITTGNFNYSLGGGASLMLGYRYGQFRTEGQFFFNTNSLDTVTFNGYEITKDNDAAGFSMKGQSDEYALFLNGYYDLFTPEDDASFVPYVGLGLGYGQTKSHVNFWQNNIQINAADIQQKQSNPMGQIILGASYYLDDYTSFGLDYRYVAVLKSSSNDNDINSGQKFKANTLNLSFNYSFDTSND